MILKITKRLKAAMVAAFLLLSLTQTNAQLIVNHSFTPSQLVSQVLLGTGITVSNITYVGDTGQIGFFNGAASNIGLPSGVILTTGNIYNATGAVGGPTSNFGGTSLYTAGDAQLTALCGSTTNDAGILEFDFVPTGDTVKFNYVFGSEEYPEFVGSFNDFFAFFISGPGIVGTPNIATLPASVTPVSINSVNNGSGFCPGGNPTGPCSNCAYYIDNCGGLTCNYPGFTVPLTAKHWVIPCQTYHIKIAIADAVDAAYDSGVFLEQGSFTGGTVSINSHVHNTGTTNDTMLVEGCTSGSVLFAIGQAQNTPYVVHFTIGGTAVNGVDYPFVVDSLVIPAGQVVDSINFAPFFDNIVEGNESIIITVTSISLCSTTTDSIVLWIKDVNPIQLTMSGDTTICPNQSVPLTATATQGYSTYTYLWDNGAGNAATVNVSPANTTTYTVTVTDVCGNTATGSVTVTVTSPETIAVTNPNVIEGCGTATVTFTLNIPQATPTVITYAVTGTATNGVDYPSLPGSVTIPANQASTSISISPVYDGITEPVETIIITLTNTCMPSSVTINIADEPTIVPSITGYDICQGQTTQLVASAVGGTGPLTYTWSSGLGDSTIVHPSPSSTTVYSVSVTDTCHAQTGVDTITIYVFPIPNAYFLFDYLEATNINIVNLSTNAVSYAWTFGDGGLSNTTQHSFEHLYPDTVGSYFITLIAYNQEGCPDTNTARVSFTDDYSFFIPTSFHPGFPLNPTFGVYSNGIVEYQMDIYDRWGEHLFTTTDLSIQWDGASTDGTLLKQDVYVWVMKALMKNGKKVEKNGTVFLIR